MRGKIAVILLTIALIALIYFLVRDSNNKKYKVFVLENSIAIKNIKEINRQFVFKNIQPYNWFFSYDNEKIFREISPQDYLTYQLVYLQKSVKKDIKDTADNCALYERYQEQIKKFVVLGKYGTVEPLKNRQKLLKTEEEILDSLVQNPCISLSIFVRLRLTNIRGRIRDSKNGTFNAEQIEQIIEKLNQKSGDYYLNNDVWETICRVERGKVTNRMRFAIYERDNYCCRKCGRRTDDLEIDHIFPISKGGKSNFENLQTLCHSCNTRKSNTVEYGTVAPQFRTKGKSKFCVLCGAPMLLRKGKYGQFYGCSNYPRCKHTEQIAR